MRARSAMALLLGAFGCGADPMSPSQPSAAVSATSVAGQPSAHASQPTPAPAGSVVAPPASAAASSSAPATPAGELREVLRSPYHDTRAYAVPGGAFVAGHALVVAFAGADARQDAAWLEGLPEILGWDADVELALPPLASPPGLAMPAGTFLSVHAGNVHGPAELRAWDGRTWARRFAPPSAPRVRLTRGLDDVLVVLELRNGDLAAVGTTRSGTEARVLAAGAASPLVLPIPHRPTDWVRAWLAGNTLADLHVCLRHGEIFALGARGAVSVDAPAGTLADCAMTAGGKLWVVTDTPGKPGTLERRGNGWETVALPAELSPRQVSAAGERVWVTAEAARANEWVVLSTEPVATPLHVRSVHLPAPVFFGISSLDGKGPDVPSVSPAPAAPATRACTALLVHLGPKPTPALRSALLADPGAAKLSIVRASGVAPGKLVPEPPSGTRLVPSQILVTALAGVPPSFDEGTRIVETLRKAALDPPPSLICAVPRNPKPLGTAEQLLP